MKILQLCKKFPYPLNDGESIAVSFLSKGLAELGHSVDLLSMNTSKHYTKIAEVEDDIPYFNQINTVDIDNRLKVSHAFFNLFSKKSYHVVRFESRAYRKRLEEILQNNRYDIVQLETPYLALYLDTIRKYSDAKVVLRAHNIEHEIWERVSQNEASLAKKKYLELCTRRLKKFELEKMNQFDFLAAITQRDFDAFNALGYKKEGCILPVGLDIKEYEPHYRNNKQISLCFIGSLDWMPNTHGLSWFIENVWPEIHRLNPKIQFHIAGKNPGDRITNLRRKNIVIHGEVPNAIDFINRHDILVVPLFSGSGMRVKILEGMALGKTIITTGIGVEGIEAENGKHILVADTKEQFTACVSKYLKDKTELNKISAQARQLVEQKYDYIFRAKSLANEYESLLTYRNLAPKNKVGSIATKLG